MEFQYETKTGSLRIFTPREIDECAASEMREEADMLIDNYQIRQLIFDFSNTEFMDSSVIGVMIGRKHTMELYHGDVFAIHMGDRAKRIFEKSGLDRIVRTDF